MKDNLPRDIVSSNDGHYIGISDGKFAFDIFSGASQSDKCRASLELRDHQEDAAKHYWTQALAQMPADAESLIYRENERIKTTRQPYTITFIIGTTLTNSLEQNIVGSDWLRGVYAAQEEYNRNSSYFKVRLLIANFGGNLDDASTVIDQMVQVAQEDRTIKGVINIPYLSDLINQDVLSKLTLPIIMPSSSNETPNEKAQSIFHIASSTAIEGADGAKYLMSKKVQKVVVFVDHHNPYSNKLAEGFESQFDPNGQCKSDRCIEQTYDVNNTTATLDQTHVSIALHNLPDEIYFAGTATNADSILTQIPTSGRDGHLRVMGGDALYEPGVYNNYERLDFTASAYADEWTMQGRLQHAFFDEYALHFAQWDSRVGYGFARPRSGAVLAYDALSTFLQGATYASAGLARVFSPMDLQTKLTQMSGACTEDKMQQNIPCEFHGFSGRIAFESNRMPIDKIVFVLTVNDNDETQWTGLSYGVF